jgi:regulatory protein
LNVVERSEAVEAAVRALRTRDRSAAELDERLRARGVADDERREVLGTLERIGYVDDERFARARAEALAQRGSGDALVRDDLERRGIAAETIAIVVAGLEPERVRAERVAARRGRTAKTARYLASRGFDADAVTAAVAPDGADALE